MLNLSTNSLYQLSIENVRSMPVATYFGTKILFVIRGSLTVSTKARDYVLHAHDILILNRNEQFSLMSHEDNIVITVSLSAQFFSQHDKAYFTYTFDCFSRELLRGREQMLALLRRYLAEMIIAYSRSGELQDLELQSSLFQTMRLIRFFRTETSSIAIAAATQENERMTRIMQEIEQRYDEPLTLNEIAAQQFLSVPYFSKYFKRMTGMGFVQYINHIRLNYSLNDLLHSKDSLTQIAVRHGFVSSKNYNIVFKAKYGVSPAHYRKEHADIDEYSVHSSKHPLSELRTVLRSPEVLTLLARYIDTGEQITTIHEAGYERKQIEIDSTSQNSIASTTHILIVGELKDILQANIRDQVLMAKRNLRIDYIGVRNLIVGSTLLPEVDTDEHVATSTPFMNVDLALQFLQLQQLKLIIRIEYQNIISDEERYFKLLDQFICHVIHMFGRDYVAGWRFTFYEPASTIASAAELERVYRKLHVLIKHREQRIQVGIFLSHCEWQFKCNELIEYVEYEANANEIVDFENPDDHDFKQAQNYINTVTARIKALLKKRHMERPLFLMSWNTLTGNTRYTNGTFFRGALIMRAVLDLSRQVDALGFWINSEQHEEIRSARKISIDGLELFHYLNGKRPAYYALMFKERLRGRIISQGADFIMTEYADGYQLVLLNESHFNPRFSVEELFLKERRKEYHVEIIGMKPGAYQIRKYQYDRDHGALYTEMWKLKSIHNIDSETLEYVNHRATPELSIIDEVITEPYSFYTYLDMNAIVFYEYRRIIEDMI